MNELRPYQLLLTCESLSFFFTYLFIYFLAPQVIPVTSKGDFDLLKSRIASTKAEIRREEGVSGLNSPDSSPSMKV